MLLLPLPASFPHRNCDGGAKLLFGTRGLAGPPCQGHEAHIWCLSWVMGPWCQVPNGTYRGSYCACTLGSLSLVSCSKMLRSPSHGRHAALFYVDTPPQFKIIATSTPPLPPGIHTSVLPFEACARTTLPVASSFRDTVTAVDPQH